MLGLLINESEQNEMEYLIKREMEEILLDLDDDRIDQVVKQAMRKRYHSLFQMFRRVASQDECLKYMPKQSYNQNVNE